MLSDRLCQLLTGHVDGELSARQCKAVARLLRQSPEARAFIEQLEQDAHRLRNLPQQKPARDFAVTVLAALHERPLSVPPLRPAGAVARRVPV